MLNNFEHGEHYFRFNFNFTFQHSLNSVKMKMLKQD